ncbi:uncharacterized protein LOC128883788 isoform X3 [Hylaeus volcanicus]|uniref:uncharacterized protein LOC128883788 isoform X3 n=1 Tax=Hylaeus volcanicus TaxID=313075 RepID=UPI0023B844D0|nr:uncharacterized protein LOC128883788 isoform X3 [Hylaeus volcanicus]
MEALNNNFFSRPINNCVTMCGVHSSIGFPHSETLSEEMMTQRNNYGFHNIGYNPSCLQSVSLAELRNSFQTFSQAEQKQTVKTEKQKRKVVKLKAHMRVLPMREHSAIRYYPVVDPLNKGAHYLMCGHCSTKHLFGQFDMMKRHLKRCKGFLHDCHRNNTATIELQLSQLSTRDSISNSQPDIDTMIDMSELSQLHASQAGEKNEHGLKSIQYYNDKEKRKQHCSFSTSWIGRKKCENEIYLSNSQEEQMNESCSAEISSTFNGSFLLSNLQNKEKNSTTINGYHSSNVIEKGFSKLNKLPSENKQLLREENLNNSCMTAYESRVLSGVSDYKDCFTISTQTSVSYLKNSKRKQEKHNGCSRTSITKISNCTLSTTTFSVPQPKTTSLTLAKEKKSVKKGSVSDSKNSTSNKSPKIKKRNMICKISKTLYNFGDLAWILNASNFWPILILGVTKTLSENSVYFVFMIETNQVQTCAEKDIKSWEQGLQCWSNLSTGMRRANKIKYTAVETAKCLLNKNKEDYLSILNIPQPIFDKVHQLLLEGTTKSFTLVSEIFEDTLSFKTKMNGVCETDQSAGTGCRHGRYGVHRHQGIQHHPSSNKLLEFLGSQKF